MWHLPCFLGRKSRFHCRTECHCESLAAQCCSCPWATSFCSDLRMYLLQIQRSKAQTSGEKADRRRCSSTLSGGSSSAISSLSSCAAVHHHDLDISGHAEKSGYRVYVLVNTLLQPARWNSVLLVHGLGANKLCWWPLRLLAHQDSALGAWSKPQPACQRLAPNPAGTPCSTREITVCSTREITVCCPQGIIQLKCIQQSPAAQTSRPATGHNNTFYTSSKCCLLD